MFLQIFLQLFCKKISDLALVVYLVEDYCDYGVEVWVHVKPCGNLVACDINRLMLDTEHIRYELRQAHRKLATVHGFGSIKQQRDTHKDMGPRKGRPFRAFGQKPSQLPTVGIPPQRRECLSVSSAYLIVIVQRRLPILLRLFQSREITPQVCSVLHFVFVT